MANEEHRKFQWDFQVQKQEQFEAKMGDYGVLPWNRFALDHVANPVGCEHGHGSNEVASSTF